MGPDILWDAIAVQLNCTTAALTAAQAAQFGQAVHDRWFYQVMVDDLPAWVMVGELLPAHAARRTSNNATTTTDNDVVLSARQRATREDTYVSYVYTKRNLVIEYNGDRVVRVDLTSDPRSLVKVTAGRSLTFAMQVQWKEALPSTLSFAARYDRYYDHEFFRQQDSWWGVLFLLPLVLVGLVTMILLRALNNDNADDGDVDAAENQPLQEGKNSIGWKKVQGDVFREPSRLPLLASWLGAGWQLVTLTVLSVLMPGMSTTAILVCYGLASAVGGYKASCCFRQYSRTMSMVVVTTTAALLPTTWLLVSGLFNAMSLMYGTIISTSFLDLAYLYGTRCFVSMILGSGGAVLAGLMAATGSEGNGAESAFVIGPFPCRHNEVPRPIPKAARWYGKPWCVIPLAGLVGFVSIFVQVNHAMMALWSYKCYRFYSSLCALVILTMVVSGTSIICVYHCLNAENYHWQWIPAGNGAAVALYVMLYGLYYFVVKTQMHGLLQTTTYFGTMTVMALHLGLLSATVGHAAASRFVHVVYQNLVKVD